MLTEAQPGSFRHLLSSAQRKNSQLYILIKKEMSASHICEFSPNDCSFFFFFFFFFFISLFCFKKYDYLTMLCTKKKSIRCRCTFTATTTTTPQAPVPKLRKSHNQYLACLPFALFTAAHPCLTERTSYEYHVYSLLPRPLA